MSRLRYEDDTFKRLKESLNAATQELRSLKMQLDRKPSYCYELQYRDPEPNFDRSTVHGMLGKLFTVRDERNFLAFTMCAGGHVSFPLKTQKICIKVYILFLAVQLRHR